jgi:hypothetical protein
MVKRVKSSPPLPSETIGKRIQFDLETWQAVEVLARDQMKEVQELTEEAFRDLLKKYGRTADFREALRMSVKAPKKPRSHR